MSQDEPSGPDLDGVVADANAVGLSYVVIGGFSVIAVSTRFEPRRAAPDVPQSRLRPAYT